jgi:glycerate 2-kinase
LSGHSTHERSRCILQHEELSYHTVKVLIAPNALKGSLSAREATAIIAASLPKGWEAILCPIADGGDGTLECLIRATQGEYFSADVTGPLSSQLVNAKWGRLGNADTAVIEMAEASGLRLLSRQEYSATISTTFGVGELIVRALNAGNRRIVVGLGGSATNDGGAGCAQALGVRFLDSRGMELRPGGLQLRELYSIDISKLDSRVSQSTFIGLADVNNPLLGPAGATRVFGPQKGAREEELTLLDEALKHYAGFLRKQAQRDVAGMPGSGAAGGLGAGLIAFLGAEIVPGTEYILDLVRFDNLLMDCDMVLTAEGSIDEQSFLGKGISGIARRAKRFRKPVHAFAGRVGGNPRDLCRQLTIDSIHQISPPEMSEQEAVGRVRELLSSSVRGFLSGFE